VIKADGLAAGKGVVVANTVEEAHQAIDHMLVDNRMGEAGARVVIEEFLAGEEASFIVMVDGRNILPLASSQDHKRLRDGDKGPNTGGMGAYSPAPLVTPAIHAKVLREIIRPAVEGMAAEGTPYTGFLYAGLMIDASASASSVDSGVVRTLAGDYRMSTQGRSAGLRATRLLPRLGVADPSLSLGIDWKHVVPHVGGSAAGPSLVPDVLLRPITLSYAMRSEDAGTRFAGQLGVSRNVPGRGRSAASVFAEPGLRAGATPHYLLWRADLQWQHSMGATQLILGWNGQWTRSILVPAEQFSAGGLGSVRGFEGRLATGDAGHRGGVELQGPLPTALQPAGMRLGWQVYADAARLRRHQPLAGESPRAGLASAGLGLRVDGPGTLSVRGDAAVVTQGGDVSRPGKVFVHLTAHHGF